MQGGLREFLPVVNEGVLLGGGKENAVMSTLIALLSLLVAIAHLSISIATWKERHRASNEQ